MEQEREDMVMRVDEQTRLDYLYKAVGKLLERAMAEEGDNTQRMILENHLRAIRGFPYSK
ncbi:hypothetical protein [Candidatus Poriferisocius sp.]|uniref:hypothetical protein n=1 Tax=Candidatus Poriferisocius sp. TaxID=3101276 RepID=UPI003B0197B6